jgi:hypothetical protein
MTTASQAFNESDELGMMSLKLKVLAFWYVEE